MRALWGRVFTFFPFITLNISCHSLLACRVSAEKSADSLMGVPLYVTSCFSLAVFNILSLSLIFAILITCLSVILFGLILFGTLCSSWTWMSVSSPRLGKTSAIMSSSMFSVPFSLSSPSGTRIMQMLVCLILSQKSLKLSSFFKICFSFFSSAWVVSTALSFSLLFYSPVSSNLLLIPSSVFLFQLFFSSIWFFFIFSNSLLNSSLCSSVLLPSSLSILTTPCPLIFLMWKHPQCFPTLFLNNYRFLYISLFQVLSLHFSLPILIQNKNSSLLSGSGLGLCTSLLGGLVVLDHASPSSFPPPEVSLLALNLSPCPPTDPPPTETECNWVECMELKQHRWCPVGPAIVPPVGHCTLQNQLTKIEPFKIRLSVLKNLSSISALRVLQRTKSLKATMYGNKQIPTKWEKQRRFIQSLLLLQGSQPGSLAF